MRCAIVMATLLLAGCNSFAPPRTETLTRLAPMPLAAALGDTFVLELESEHLAGVFDVVCVLDEGALRLQLFPDIGGKVLDLTAREGRVVATTPDGDYEASPPLDDAEPHLALVLAGLLAELRVPLSPAGRH